MDLENNNLNQTNTSMMSTTSRATMNILCCMCGISFNPQQSKTNICITCLSSRTDITNGITKQAILNFCRMCRRYQRPPWVYMERESRDLLTLCLKKIKGLNKVKLIDAQFIWTEPHSRRIKIRVTIQKEVINKTSLQHTFEVEFFEHYMQCDDCKKEFTPHQWTAVVQVRQRVAHKKTFFFLEQQILKNNAHQHLLKVEEKDDGLDFFYKSKQHAFKLVEYLQTVLPTKIKPSKQLVSWDEQNDIYTTKHSWSIEIPRICKDDLVLLPPKLCKELGGCCPLMLCVKLSTSIRLLEPKTMKRVDLNPARYYHYESDIQVLNLKNNSSEFLVNDFNKKHDSNLNESYLSSTSNMFIDKIYDINVSRTSDWEQFDLKTHLGSAVRVGATLQGYDLTKINFEEIDKIRKQIPEIIIVKRVFDKSNRNKRIWKLNRIDQEGVMVEDGTQQAEKKQKKSNARQKKYEVDNQAEFEEFQDDIEFDKDLQRNVRLIRNEENIKKLTKKQLERRSKQKKQRKVVVVTKHINRQDDNIFNKPKNLQTINENEELIDDELLKNKNSNKLQEQQQEQQQEEEEQEDSDEEEAGVKLFQLEDIGMFDKLRIDDGDDENGEEGGDEQQEHQVEQFIKDLESIQLDKKKK